ncbi:Uncharacterised protein [Vibrio cholerae]|nr:Uncharacterised protein [Vibrio cholerae]CSA77990.1 Uncharacterised protein [Vibrio cholerae]CSA96522.1 Uncharacterised protein [Vibrio cholerae]CSB51800.1 Uncharacterised protein [Vibrio cholerae]CSC86966.1 Uncharacterised protein [Vibrio cholerae]
MSNRIKGVDVRRAQSFIFLIVDPPRDLACRPLFIIQIVRFDEAFEQTLLIVTVDDLKIFQQLSVEIMGAQNTMANTVESTTPHARGGAMHQLFNSATHFGCSFVGKGHRHHRKR